MSGNHSHNGEHHPEPQSYAALRTKAIESLLIEKGLLSTDAIDVRVQAYEQDIGPLNGAKVVVRAWTDAEYKRRLLEDGTAAIAELGFFGAQGAEIIVLEEHTDGSQCGRMHALLLLPLARAWPAAALVQVGCLQGEGGHRAASRAAGVRAGAGRIGGGACVGQQLGYSIYGIAGATGGHEEYGCGCACCAGNAGQHDWRGASQDADADGLGRAI